MDLEISYTDPRAVVVGDADCTWVVSGMLADQHPAFDAAAHDGSAEAALCRRIGDATVLRVDHPEGEVTRVRMWRGAISSHELYAVRLPDGHTVIADHFRNVIARIPVEVRRASEQVAIDHFVFRYAAGHQAFAEGVERVGHGDVVELDPRTGRVERSVFERLESGEESRPRAMYAVALGEALASATARVGALPGLAVMFSGGMDSTLIQSYLGPDVPSLHLSVDDPRFAFGGAHMKASAALLGLDPRQVVIHADEFLGHVEAAVDARAVPPQHPQWVTLGQAFASDHETFVFGERAGIFARLGGKMPHRAGRVARLPRPLVRAGSWPVARLSRPRRLHLIAEQAPLMAEDPMSPDGWGAQMPQEYGDRRWAERVFGADRVRARYQARLDYIAGRVALLPPSSDRYFRHLEIASWGNFFCENQSQFLSFALARGKSITDPFASPEVIGAALSIPATERYEDGIRGKYVIADLLRQRLPAYPASTKDPIRVPYVEDYRSGPLGTVWEAYDLPDFFSGPERRRLLEHPGLPAWNAITWAIWRDRIERNPGLTPLPSTVSRTWAVDPDQLVA